MRTNFDEFRRKVSKTFENERYFEPNEFSSKFRCFFETAIVLPFAKNRANLRKVRRNFERHFADSIEFSQLNSKRASKFRRLFRKVLKKLQNIDREFGDISKRTKREIRRNSFSLLLHNTVCLSTAECNHVAYYHSDSKEMYWW